MAKPDTKLLPPKRATADQSISSQNKAPHTGRLVPSNAGNKIQLNPNALQMLDSLISRVSPDKRQITNDRLLMHTLAKIIHVMGRRAEHSNVVNINTSDRPADTKPR